MDSYGYRTIGDITRLQELRFQQTTQQQQSSTSDVSVLPSGPHTTSAPFSSTPAPQVSQPLTSISSQIPEAIAKHQVVTEQTKSVKAPRKTHKKKIVESEEEYQWVDKNQ